MLKQLVIQNIALIDNLKVELYDGLNVLSGETGAGKSIIIDSLSFVLGGKFDKTLIRSGEKQASVSAFFLKLSQLTKQKMIELGLDESDELILFRSAGEKNECKVNGCNVTLGMLKQISETLVDIHGQNENQRILNEKNQLEILDGFCGNEAIKLKDEISSLVSTIQEVKSQIEKIGGDKEEQERRIDFLKYQVKEIEDAKIKENEDVFLLEERNRMLAGEKINTNLDFALNELDGQLNLSQVLSEAISHLLSVSVYDKTIESLAERLKSSKIEINDIIDEIKELKNGLNFSQFEFDKIDSRLDQIKSLKKKYGSTTEEIFDFLNKTKKQIDEIENSSDILEKLEKQKAELVNIVNQKCEMLSSIRQKGATNFELKVCSELNDLVMKNAKFKIDFKKCEINRTGFDKIEFLFSANAGQEIKPLGKIISGGEMSRFCLAIKNITKENENIGTMVFDEIDTGISGKVAEVVAEKLVKISRDRQCLSITHLPQIVAMADVCIKVEKQTISGATKTSVSPLDENGQILEVARLIGSNMASLHANDHAKDLVEFGKQFKLSLTKE